MSMSVAKVLGVQHYLLSYILQACVHVNASMIMVGHRSKRYFILSMSVSVYGRWLGNALLNFFPSLVSSFTTTLKAY